MLFTLAFFAISAVSAAMFILHQPSSPLVFYSLGLVLVLAVALSAVLMGSLFSALCRGPVDY